MGIDIHISNSLDVEFFTQGFDQDTKVTNRAEPGRLRTGGMMKSGDGNKNTAQLPFENSVQCIQIGANHERRRLVNTRYSRRVATIQVSHSYTRHLFKELDVIGIMKTRKFVIITCNRLENLYLFGQIRAQRLVPESVEPVYAERVIVAKSIAPQTIANINTDPRAFRIHCITRL